VPGTCTCNLYRVPTSYGDSARRQISDPLFPAHIGKPRQEHLLVLRMASPQTTYKLQVTSVKCQVSSVKCQVSSIQQSQVTVKMSRLLSVTGSCCTMLTRTIRQTKTLGCPFVLLTISCWVVVGLFTVSHRPLRIICQLLSHSTAQNLHDLVDNRSSIIYSLEDSATFTVPVPLPLPVHCLRLSVAGSTDGRTFCHATRCELRVASCECEVQA
jgi:hypothetical protein